MVTLARIDVLPDDGPVGPKHVGVINFNVLISVKSFKVWKILEQKTLVQVVGLIIYICVYLFICLFLILRRQYVHLYVLWSDGNVFTLMQNEAITKRTIPILHVKNFATWHTPIQNAQLLGIYQHDVQLPSLHQYSLDIWIRWRSWHRFFFLEKMILMVRFGRC